MTIKKPKIKLYADPRKQPEDTYLIQVQISYGGRAYISTEMKFSLKEWEIIQDRNIKQANEYNLSRIKLDEIRDELDAFEKGAKEVAKRFVDRNIPFTATMVRDAFYDYTPASRHKLSVYYLFTSLHEIKLLNGKAPKTAESYLNARSAFLNYQKYIIGNRKGKKLSEADVELLKTNFILIQINAKYLREFKATMTLPPKDSGLKKLSSASVESYILNLRTVFNYCINEGVIGNEVYPFSRDNQNNYYKIRPAQRTKKALFEDDIKKLIEIAPLLIGVQRRALDFFIFSMLCNGANLIDIAKFEHQNIDKELNTLSFIRKKTEDNVDKLEKIVIQLSELHNQIIDRYKSNNPNNDYIFNLLDDIRENTRAEISRVVGNHLRNFRNAYKRISKKTGINIFSYQYARHTFATLAVKNSITIEEVGKSMGHANPKTTQNYIASLPVKEPTEITKLKTSLLGGYNMTDNNE